MKKIKLSLFSTALILAGCGGGSDSGGPALDAQIGSLPALNERTEVTVSGSSSTFPSSAEKQFKWNVSLVGNGTVTLSDSNTENVTLLLGEFAENTEGTLTLTVLDSEGNTDSQSIEFTVNEVDKEQLPPAPGPEGDDTVSGVDSNDNGVRDDVEIGIYRLHELNHENREILKTGAKAMQEALTATLNEEFQDNDKASEELAKFAYCLTQHSSMDRRKALAQVKTLQMNTPERVDAYNAYNQSRNGTIQRVVAATKEECMLNNSQGGN